MNKQKRVYMKQEKRIVRLLYKKGLIDINLKGLYWEEYKYFRKTNRKNKNGYKCMLYYPEIHYSTTDYWGEVDEFSLVDSITQGLYWGNAEYPAHESDGEWPESTFKFKGRNWFIKYLQALPTVRCDAKINQVLINSES